MMETGWLLDDGLLCLGVGSCGLLTLVTYTDPRAIRFSRSEDAENMKWGLLKTDAGYPVRLTKPVEHAWG